jgi:heme-degrading monooxygenase HmoA
MAHLLVIEKVEDFAKWKQAFDDHVAAREASGCKGGYIFQDAADPNNVVVLLEWDDVAQVRAFAESDSLRQAMQRGGIVGAPELFFLEEAARPAV